MSLGPHAIFIVASYSAAIAVVGGLIAWVIFDHAAQKRQLAQLEKQGVTRRSQGAASSRT